MIALKFSDEDLAEAVREVFTCRTCGGQGWIENPAFEVCLEAGHDMECDSCYYRDGCADGETLTCPDCQGEGYERLDWREFLRRLTEDADDP